MISLSEHILEKLKINKEFTGGADKIEIPKNIKANGCESFDFAIDALVEEYENEANQPIRDFFEPIKCKQIEYYFFNESIYHWDSEDNYVRKIFPKIYPNGLNEYVPIDRLMLSKYSYSAIAIESLSRFKSTDNKDVVLWITHTGNQRKYKSIYVFVAKS